jgi:hypothetical protein
MHEKCLNMPPKMNDRAQGNLRSCSIAALYKWLVRCCVAGRRAAHAKTSCCIHGGIVERLRIFDGINNYLARSRACLLLRFCCSWCPGPSTLGDIRKDASFAFGIIDDNRYRFFEVFLK